MERFGGEESTPLDHALDQCVVALDHLVKLVEDGALGGVEDPGWSR